MKIKYKTILFSVKFDLSKRNIHREHGPSLVRNKNIKTDQTLIHNEDIDETLIEYEFEDDDEELYLLDNSELSGELLKGWVVVPGVLFSRRSNANNNTQPGWMNLGKGIEGLVFADKKSQGTSMHFDLGPTYKAGTKVYIDIGWMPMSYSQGNAVFYMDWNAGSPNDGKASLMNNLQRKTVLHPGSGKDGEYRRCGLSEENAILPGIEQNGLLSVEITRAGKDYRDSFYGSLAILSVKAYFKVGE